MRNSALQPSAVLPRRDPPHRVPVRVDVAAFVGDLRVGLRAFGIGRKHKAVAPIAERVEQDFERVLIATGKVLADLVDDDAGGTLIEAADADVEVILVEEDSHFGAFRRWFAFLRFGLHESCRGRRRGPGVLAQIAVEGDRTGQPQGCRLLAAIRRGEWNGLCAGHCCRQQNRANTRRSGLPGGRHPGKCSPAAPGVRARPQGFSEFFSARLRTWRPRLATVAS